MKDVLNLYLFRHGQTDWNLQKRIQGHTDIPLNDVGHKQANELAKKFLSIEIDHIFSSDLLRALATARKLGNFKNIPIKETPLLREAFFGEAEGLYYHQAEDKFGGDLWKNFRMLNLENFEIGFPGGETKKQSVQRMISLINNHIIQENLNNVALSTHGGILKNFLAYMSDFSSPIIEIPNCVLYHVQIKNRQLMNGVCNEFSNNVVIKGPL